MSQFTDNDIYGIKLQDDPSLKTSAKNFDFKYIKPDQFDRMIRTVEHDRLNKFKTSIWKEFCQKCDKRTMLPNISSKVQMVTNTGRGKKQKRGNSLFNPQSNTSNLSRPDSPKVDLPKVRVMSEREIDDIITKAIADVMVYNGDQSSSDQNIQTLKAAKSLNTSNTQSSETNLSDRSTKSKIGTPITSSSASLISNGGSIKSLSLTSINGSVDGSSKCSFDLSISARSEKSQKFDDKTSETKVQTNLKHTENNVETLSEPQALESQKSIKLVESQQTPKSDKHLDKSIKSSCTAIREESQEFNYHQYLTTSETAHFKTLKEQDLLIEKNDLQDAKASNSKNGDVIISVNKYNDSDVGESKETFSLKYTQSDDDLNIMLSSNDSDSDSDSESDTTDVSHIHRKQKKKFGIESKEERVSFLAQKVSQKKANYISSKASVESVKSLNSQKSMQSQRSIKSMSSENSERLSMHLSKSEYSTNTSSNIENSISNTDKLSKSGKSNDSERSEKSRCLKDTSRSATTTDFLANKAKLEKVTKKELNEDVQSKKPFNKPGKMEEKRLCPINTQASKTKEMPIENADPMHKMSFLTESENEEMKRILGFTPTFPEVNFEQLDLESINKEKQIELARSTRCKSQSKTPSETQSDSGSSPRSDYDEDSDGQFSEQETKIHALVNKKLNKSKEHSETFRYNNNSSEMNMNPKKNINQKSVRLQSNNENIKVSLTDRSIVNVESKQKPNKASNTNRSLKKVVANPHTDRPALTDRGGTTVIPLTDEKKSIFTKITSHHKKIIESLDKLRLNILHLSPPDGYSEQKRREKNIMEFTVRFARNYLYPLERMIEDIRVTHSEDFRSKYTNSPCSKVCGIYGLFQQAISSYNKQIRHFVLNNNSRKLNILIKLILSFTDTCFRKKIFHHHDEVLTCLMERCNSFLQFLQDLQSSQKQNQQVHETKHSATKKNSPKHTNDAHRKLNMYECTKTQSKPKKSKHMSQIPKVSANTARPVTARPPQGFTFTWDKNSNENLISSPLIYVEPESFITPRPEVYTQMCKIKNAYDSSTEGLTSRCSSDQKAFKSRQSSEEIEDNKSEITKRAVMEVVQSIAKEEVRNLLAPFVSNLGSMLNQTNDLKSLEKALKNLNSINPTKSSRSKSNNNPTSNRSLVDEVFNNHVSSTKKQSVDEVHVVQNITLKSPIKKPKLTPKATPKKLITSPKPLVPPAPVGTPVSKYSTSSLDTALDESCHELKKNSKHRNSAITLIGDSVNNRKSEIAYHDENIVSVIHGEGEGPDVNLNKSKSKVMKQLNYNANIQYTFIRSEQSESDDNENKSADEEDDLCDKDFHLEINREHSKDSLQSNDDLDYESVSPSSHSNRYDMNDDDLNGILQDRLNFIKRNEGNPLYCNDKFSEPWKLLTKMTKNLTAEILNQTDFSATLMHEKYLEKLLRMELDL